MANVKKCDRCDRYYDTNTKYIGGALSLSRISAIKLFTTTDECHRHFDLCDDCLTEFYEFINGGVKDE